MYTSKETIPCSVCTHIPRIFMYTTKETTPCSVLNVQNTIKSPCTIKVISQNLKSGCPKFLRTINIFFFQKVVAKETSTTVWSVISSC